jgi:hypothetical protein
MEAPLNWGWGKLSKGQKAAYKAWYTMRLKKQTSEPIDLLMTPLDRATRDVIKELKCS